MKTIGKKIKAIYFLAVVAIVSICMAILPMMSTNVKADTTENLKVVGARVVVIDDTTTTQNFDGKYAVSFQAEFTKDFYESLAIKNNTVKFGMLVGPVANYDAINSIDDAEANGYVDSCYLGNKDSIQYISFESGSATCAYEATKEYSEADITADKTTDAEKLEALLEVSKQELTAIPYYVVNGEVTLVKVENPVVRSARKLINDAYASSNLEFGNNLYARYVGTVDADYSGCDYYVEKSTGKIFKADANNELVPFYGVDFYANQQLVVDGKDVEPANDVQLTLSADTMANMVEGQEYSIASFIDDETDTVRTIKAKVVTKIISTINDFFKDVDGDGVGDVAQANYIFYLEAIQNSYDGNHTTPTEIYGYYVLGANIDLQDSTELISARGDKRLLLKDKFGGFKGTLDGRGFALSNLNLSNSTSGFLGLLNGATIKDIAFDGVRTIRNDSFPSIIANNTYNSTFENVYIRVRFNNVNYGDTYVSVPKAFGTLNDKYGPNSFTNVIFENADALVERAETLNKKFDRVIFTDDTTSVYENTTVIGLPSNFSQKAHETDTEKRVLTLSISAAAMTAFGVQAGEIALADCPAAVITAYEGLIKNLETKFAIDIEYINFVEDAVRNYYVDNAGLVADTTTADAYLETGLWTVVGGKLVWNSLVAEKYSVLSTNDDPTNMIFKDSITLEMFKGDEKVDDVRIRIREVDADYITVSGNTITKIPEAALIKTRPITVDVVYTVGAKSYEVAVDLLLELDYSNLNVYQSGEFIIETSTGKVYAPNANNELVEFDATGYLAGSTELYFAGEKMTVVSANPFTIDATALEGLTLGEKQPIVAMCDDGGRYLLASTATKVIFSAKDFFVDADGSGEVEDEEMKQANYIFYLGTDSSSGLIRPQKTVKGYFALANNIDLSGVAIGNGDGGERHYQIANATGELGFNGTFDGRGFALLNGNPGRSTGMFGMFYGATVKNIAFDGFTNSIGNSNALILGRAYNSTFENIYFRITGNNGSDRYAGAGNTFTTIASADSLGVSTFNNIIFESMDGLTAGNTNRHQRQTLIGNATWGSFTNTSVIGMPVTFAYAKHTTDTEKAVLTLTLPADTITAFGVEAGEYAIADCQAAVTAFAGLIANIEEKQASQIGYINFVEDVNARNYYSNGASLAADTEVANAYIETGYWTKLGNALTWKSLVNADNFVVKSNNADPENLMFQDSISLEMYAGSILLEGIEITTAQENLELIDIDGATITKKEDVLLVKDEIIALTLTYSDGVNAYSKVVEVTLQADLSLIVEYESGEFVFDKTTGELLKANDNNELVPYDATGFAADVTEIYVAGIQTSAKNVTEFTVDASELADIPANEEIAITAIYNDGTEVGARCLKVKTATRVISEAKDLFIDADGNGTVEAEEMIQANYIFNLQVTQSSGAKLPSVAIKGYYVLASNVDLQGVSAITASTGDQSVQIWNGSADVGFRATLDGRGFAFTNVNISTSASGGMFGALYGATIKNIAFDGFTTLRNDGGTALLGYVYNSTFENVYIRAIGNTSADSYNSGNNGVYAFAVVDSHGASTFTNVVFENTDGMEAGATNKHMRATLTSTATAGNFENTALIGMPLTFKYAAHATDTSKNVLSITISTAMMTKLGVEAKEYALADCPTDAYDNLIANIATRQSIDIGYVSFVVDAKERANYLDNAELAADTEFANALVETGFWGKLGDAVAWKTLIDSEYFAVKSNNADSANMMFKDSIALDMYYGTTKLEGVVITTSQENLEFITIDGTTINKNAGALLVMDKVIEVTLTYSDGANNYSKTAEITLQANLDEIDEYESGEFIVDKATGKVLKANAKNELVPYDATAFMANMTGLYVAGAEATAIDTTAFTLNAEAVANLPVNEELAITVVYDDGTVDARCLKVKAATRVFFAKEDFYIDANEDGDLSGAEYIFYQGASLVNAYNGYYVLANNVDFGNKEVQIGPNNNFKPSLGADTTLGFTGTFDGRGFAISNIKAGWVAGIFGILNGATIKDVAFIDVMAVGDDSTNTALAWTAYATTFENVYVRAKQFDYDRPWISSTRYIASIVTPCTFTNVVFENTVGLDANKAKIRSSWMSHVDTKESTYTNTTIIGVPSGLAYGETEKGSGEYRLTIALTSAEMTKLGVSAGQYALADCEAAVTQYAGLIAGIEYCKKITISYLNFVVEERFDYYLNNASFASNADAYVETGMWTKVGNELVWATLVDDSKVAIKVTPEDGKFTDSVTIETYYGEELVDAQLSVSEADAKFVEISGNVVSKKAGAQVLADKTIIVTVTCLNTEETVELTLVYDPENVILYDESEFVIDRATGKVLKANENNELVEYDATSYLASATTVMVGEAQQTVANASAFALDKAGFEALKDGSDYLIVSGENVLSAKVVTKVLSSVADFFVDANEDGIVAEDEMTRANYIFNLQPKPSSGAAIPRIAIKGYYVLANNIDLQSNGNLGNRGVNDDGTNGSGDHTVQVWDGSKDIGFRATFDGRGFALKNINPYGSSAGMFGAFYGATVKNIAFYSATNSAGNGSGLVLGYAYNSTFENVYIKLVGNNNGDNYSNQNNSWKALNVANSHGGSTFTNLVVESFDGLAAGKTNEHQRFTWGDNVSTYKNAAIVGMPTTFSYATSTADATKYTLTIKISAEAIANFGLEAGEYGLANCEEAATVYADLIANIESRRSIDIAYINFVEDLEGRDYFLDNASLSADAELVKIYVDTGCWKVVEGSLVWASL